MADEFKNLARFGFAGIEFPVEQYAVRGSGRQHVHIYAHVPGGNPEKLGRNLYEVECSACFYKTTPNDPGKPNGMELWPNRLALLRELFEAQATDWLVIPTIGRFKAFATAWDQEFVARILNGEKTKFRFMEDTSEQFTIENIVNTQAKSVQAAAQVLAVTLEQALADQAANEFTGDKNILDGIQDAANQIFAIRDQIQLGGLLFEERVTMLVNLCREAVDTVKFFQDPSNWTLLDATKDLWAAAVQLKNDTASSYSIVSDSGSSTTTGRPHSGAGVAVKFGTYIVPLKSMTIGQVATAIYGDTSRAVELLQLNPIEDAFVITRGTSVRYVNDDTVILAA